MKLRSLCMIHATGPEAAGPVAPPQSPVAHQMRSHPPPPVYISCMLSTRGRWDEDGGGSLDLSELKHALSKTMKEAKEFNSKPDPAQQQIQRLVTARDDADGWCYKGTPFLPCNITRDLLILQGNALSFL